MSEQMEGGWKKTMAELKRLADNAKKRKITLKKSAAVDGGAVKTEEKGKRHGS